MGKKIVCIFCGNTADIIVHSDSNIVACQHCGKETEYTEYRQKLDNWLDEMGRK